jgi:phospholipid/cholesterol/gamma-HCH transport system substrate-binding protein
LSYFKIGLFIISAVVILTIGVVVLGVGAIFQKKTLVETYIDESVQGLDIGSPVKFRGVQVGKIEQITLTSVEYNTRRRYVLVRAGLAPNMFHFPLADAGTPGSLMEIEKGLRVRLASQGLTGTAYLEADYLDPARNPPLEIDWQPRYPYVPSARSRITQLSESLDRILQNIERVDIQGLVADMKKSLDTITKVAEGANIDKVVLQANAFLAEVRDTNRNLKGLINGPELKTAIGDAAAAAASARQIFEHAEKPLNQMLAELPQVTESLGKMVNKLDSFSGELPDSAAQLRQTLRRLNRILASEQQELRMTVENIRAITENAKELTEDAKKYPSQVLFGAPPPQAGAVSR